MIRALIHEWYDGDIQTVLEESSQYFYAICFDLDFEAPLRARKFLVVPIEEGEKVDLENAFGSEDLVRINETLARVLSGRMGSIAAGAFEHWKVESMRFDVDSDSYGKFFRFPLIDLLAES